MRAFYASAASIALAGGLSANADDIGAASGADDRTMASEDFSTGDGESTLLPQAKAVFAAIRQRTAPSAEGEQETVVDLGVKLAANEPDSRRDCQTMPIPGSRIREMRCYTPTAGEAALNKYQFQEEIRQLRQQDAIRVMEQAQRDRARLETVRDPTALR
jgi:hypothetical protein